MVRDFHISINLPHPRISFSYTHLESISFRKCSVVVLRTAPGIELGVRLGRLWKSRPY